MKPDSDLRRGITYTNGQNTEYKDLTTESGLPIVSEVPDDKGKVDKLGDPIGSV